MVHGDTKVSDMTEQLKLSLQGFLGGSDRTESACGTGDLSSITGSGRLPGEGNGYALQYSCLENPMTEEPDGSMESQRVGCNGATNARTHIHTLRQKVVQRFSEDGDNGGIQRHGVPLRMVKIFQKNTNEDYTEL